MTTHPTPEALAKALEQDHAEDRTNFDHMIQAAAALRTLSAELAAAIESNTALRVEAGTLHSMGVADINKIQALTAERDSLRAERDAAFAMSRCECGTDEACANLAKLRAEVERLRKPLDAQAARAIAVSLELGRVSVSSVQRKLEIGWNESQALCQRIVDAGWVDGLPLAPILTVPPVAEGE
jgi:chromosome segregation ATPase